MFCILHFAFCRYFCHCFQDFLAALVALYQYLVFYCQWVTVTDCPSRKTQRVTVECWTLTSRPPWPSLLPSPLRRLRPPWPPWPPWPSWSHWPHWSRWLSSLRSWLLIRRVNSISTKEHSQRKKRYYVGKFPNSQAANHGLCKKGPDWMLFGNFSHILPFFLWKRPKWPQLYGLHPTLVMSGQFCTFAMFCLCLCI